MLLDPYYLEYNLNYKWWQLSNICIIDNNDQKSIYLWLEINAHPTIKIENESSNNNKKIEFKVDLEKIENVKKYQNLHSFIKMKFLSMYFTYSKKGKATGCNDIETLLKFNEDSNAILITQNDFLYKMQRTNIYLIEQNKRKQIEQLWKLKNKQWSVDPKIIYAQTIQDIEEAKNQTKTCYGCGKSNLNYYDNKHYICNVKDNNIIDGLIYNIWNQDYSVKIKKIEDEELDPVIQQNIFFFWPFVKRVHISISEYYLKRYIVNDQHQFKFEDHPYPIEVEQFKNVFKKIKEEIAKQVRIQSERFSNVDCCHCLYSIYHFKKNNNGQIYFNINYNIEKIQKFEDFVQNLNL